MKKRTYILSLLVMCLSLTTVAQITDKKILIFSMTTGFRHSSIEEGKKALEELLRSHQYQYVHSEDPSVFQEDSLNEFDAVLFLNTSGDLFTPDQKRAFQNFIRSGKGFVGVHAASDTELEWPWFYKLVGARFVQHPAIQEAVIHVVDRSHISTSHLGKTWKHTDEWYDFDNLNPAVSVLMTLDEKSYAGGIMGDHHPIAWYHEFEGGRSFYTGLGHTNETYHSEKFLRHLLGGIRYVTYSTSTPE